MKCVICEKEMEPHENIDEHHISYPVNGFPEIKVKIHERCHDLIHGTDHFEDLKPKDGHGKLYYNDIKESKRMIDANYIVGEILATICITDRVRFRRKDVYKKADTLGYDISKDDVIKELESRDYIRKIREYEYIYLEEELWEDEEKRRKDFLRGWIPWKNNFIR